MTKADRRIRNLKSEGASETLVDVVEISILICTRDKAPSAFVDLIKTGNLRFASSVKRQVPFIHETASSQHKHLSNTHTRKHVHTIGHGHSPQQNQSDASAKAARPVGR